MSEKVRKASALAAAVIFVFVDQITKGFAVGSLKETGKMTMTVIPGLLEFSYLENPAAALGLFGNVIWLVIALAALVAVGIVAALFIYKEHSFFSYAASTLLLAGGVGNLIDRIAMDGKVVDFIHVLFFPYVFNVADCCVTVGAVCLLLHYFLRVRKEKQRDAGAENAKQEQ